jgi:hypothetical protein
MSKKANVSHDEWMIEELRSGKTFAAEYLHQAMADMNDAEGRGTALPALRRLAEAHGAVWPKWQRKRAYKEKACTVRFLQTATPRLKH